MYLKMTILQFLRDNVPVRYRKLMRAPFAEVSTFREFILDWWSYRNRHRGSAGKEVGREGDVTRLYHSIEKGLSLPQPRRPFGLGVRESLLVALGEGEMRSGDEVRSNDMVAATYGHDALRALDLWNDSGVVCDEAAPPLSSLPAYSESKFLDGGPEGFFASRRSVRNFDVSKRVDIDLIGRAVGMARHTPSVCNRQAGRVHVFTEKAQIQEILALQNGNVGFRNNVPAVAVVTVVRGLFSGPGERNQRWVDGGLFAMSFVWALHAVGLSSCMLNWSEGNAASRRLREEAVISPSEDVVVLVALGHASSGARVARSERRSVGEILTIH